MEFLSHDFRGNVILVLQRGGKWKTVQASWTSVVEKILPGAIGIDSVALPEGDVVHDLNTFPYPFHDGNLDEIHITHVIEHLSSITRTMEEIHRLAKPDAKVVIVTRDGS